MTLDPAGLEAAAKALQADRGAPTTHAGRYDSHRATVAVRAYLAAVLPPDEENPRRWFVGVSADRPMEIQFTEANGPGGWVQADEHDRAVARAFAAGRAAATPDPPCAHGLTGGRGATERCFECGASVPAASPDERLRERTTARPRRSATITADEWAESLPVPLPIDAPKPSRNVRWGARADDPPTEIHNDPEKTRAYLAGLAAGRSEKLVTTDHPGRPDGTSVPDQTRRIVVHEIRHGRGGLDVPVGCTVGEAALLAAEMFGVRVGPNDRPSFGLRGTGLHVSDPLPDDEDYDLFVIGGTV